MLSVRVTLQMDSAKLLGDTLHGLQSCLVELEHIHKMCAESGFDTPDLKDIARKYFFIRALAQCACLLLL